MVVYTSKYDESKQLALALYYAIRASPNPEVNSKPVFLVNNMGEICDPELDKAKARAFNNNPLSGAASSGSKKAFKDGDVCQAAVNMEPYEDSMTQVWDPESLPLSTSKEECEAREVSAATFKGIESLMNAISSEVGAAAPIISTGANSGGDADVDGYKCIVQ
jgi:hypothetical protein